MFNRMRGIILLGILGIAANAAAEDARKGYSKVTRYATVLGRAQACDEEIAEAMGCVEAWMDKTFVGEERVVQGMLFANRLKYGNDQQKRGSSQISCYQALREFKQTECDQSGPRQRLLPSRRSAP